MMVPRHRRRVLLLGASGKVGRMLTRYWAGSPPSNLQIIGQVRGPAGNGEVSWSVHDDPATLPMVNAVVSLWGVSPRSGRSYSENEGLGVKTLEIARLIGAERVLLASTSAVYGNSVGVRHMESTGANNPAGAYGQSKLVMENASADWARQCGNQPQVLSMRIGNVIGADSLFAAMEAASTVTLDQFASGGGPRRSYVTPGDLARTIEALLDCPTETLPDVLNIAGTRPIAMHDLVIAAGGRVAWQDAPKAAIESVEMDTSRLEALTGILPESSDAVRAIAGWQMLKGDA
ncbi:MAG: NAD(P)-dependent oxidoreductase [Rhodobacteraceae bacterium]|nr:NAD(P)-dependent oxidoreductase [Paracoccaceae bacterium]